MIITVNGKPYHATEVMQYADHVELWDGTERKAIYPNGDVTCFQFGNGEH